MSVRNAHRSTCAARRAMRIRFGHLCKDACSNSLTRSQKLVYVVFQNQFGMNLGPVVCCAIKGKKEFDVLQRLSVEYTFEGTERPRRIGSFQEDMCSASKDCSFLCAVWLWGQRYYTQPFTESVPPGRPIDTSKPSSGPPCHYLELPT